MCALAPELAAELGAMFALAQAYAELTGDEGAQADVTRAAALLKRYEEC